jgi:hypothetical protein
MREDSVEYPIVIQQDSLVSQLLRAEKLINPEFVVPVIEFNHKLLVTRTFP